MTKQMKDPGAGDAGVHEKIAARCDSSNPIADQSKCPKNSRPAEEIVELLERKFPACFAVYEKNRRPLKVGIFADLIAALAGEISEEEIRQALKIYVSNLCYLDRSVAGAARVDLDGADAGIVTAEEERYARNGWRRSAAIQRSMSAEPPSHWRGVPDPNGAWCRSRPHPANAAKPRLKLKRAVRP
jgi:ProP effector